MSENENTAPEDLPEFLNTEPDTTGEAWILLQKLFLLISIFLFSNPR